MLYTLRFYDSAGVLVSKMEMVSKDDESAAAIFNSIKREYTMELWQGDRLITRADAERQTG